MSRNKPTGSEGKGESVAERAVRGVLGGWVYGKVTIGECFIYGVGKVEGMASVEVPPEAVKEMLRREKAQKREKARAKSDPGGYIGEALSSIGDQQRAGKKNTKRKGTR